MNGWRLPVTVEVGGQPFSIRSDFRAVLDALSAMQADDLPPEEQRLACLRILYPRWQELPSLAEAFTEAMKFINLGRDVDTDLPAAAPLADWGEDVQLIAPAVDEVLGYSCRQCAYLHWWDFLGAYMNIDPEGLFGTVIRIRSKRRKGQKLDKSEEEFCRNNPELVKHKHKKTEEELRLLALLGE